MRAGIEKGPEILGFKEVVIVRHLRRPSGIGERVRHKKQKRGRNFRSHPSKDSRAYYSQDHKRSQSVSWAYLSPSLGLIAFKRLRAKPQFHALIPISIPEPKALSLHPTLHTTLQSMSSPGHKHRWCQRFVDLLQRLQPKLVLQWILKSCMTLSILYLRNSGIVVS